MTLVVNAGEHDRRLCPVTAVVPNSSLPFTAVELKDKATGKTIPCQVTKAPKTVALTWLIDGLKAGQRQTLIATPTDASRVGPKVQLNDVVQDGRVDVSIGGSSFTSYHYGPQWVRPFLHPILGPGNARITRGYPVDKDVPGEKRDHPHHKSIWVAYGECDKVDNWSEDEGHGWQRHRDFLRKESGPVFGRLTAKNDWCASNERKQFEETRDIVFWAYPGGERLVDITVTFRMTERQVTFHDTKEGGLISVRVASSMDVPVGGRIENGYGAINEDENWGKRAPWCDYSGMADGQHVGIAILDHDSNPRYPTWWHVRNYGLMTANCFGWSHFRPEAKAKGDMVFKKGSKTTWRYRLFIHKGDARKGNVAARFHDFVAPPKITIE